MNDYVPQSDAPKNEYGIDRVFGLDNIPPDDLIQFFNGPMRVVHEISLKDCSFIEVENV